LEALETFLARNLADDVYRHEFENELTELIQENLPQDQEKDFAHKLAHQCAEDDPKAVAEVKRILESDDWSYDRFVIDVRAEKVQELVKAYAHREPTAQSLINKLLADSRASIESLVADVLERDIDYIERIDRLIHVAEDRRNDALHELDRRRAVLGEALRRSVQEIEDGEFEVIETTSAKGKNAA
jgi:hypothetical protein